MPDLPELNCVEAIILSVPEIDNVHPRDVQDGRYLSITGLHPGDRLYYFDYQIDGIPASLRLTVDYRDAVHYMQRLVSVGPFVEQWHVDLFRPVMLKIERALEERCSLTELTTSVEETCWEVDCEPVQVR